MIHDDKDNELLALLRANSRASTTDLARKLGLSRSTVKDRIERLEHRGIITGYTIRFSEDYQRSQIQAHVMITSDPKHTAKTVKALKQLDEVTSVHTVSGIYDMIAMISAESTQALDQAIDKIGDIEGIERTISSIILSTKFEK